MVAKSIHLGDFHFYEGSTAQLVERDVQKGRADVKEALGEFMLGEVVELGSQAVERKRVLRLRFLIQIRQCKYQ